MNVDEAALSALEAVAKEDVEESAEKDGGTRGAM